MRNINNILNLIKYPLITEKTISLINKKQCVLLIDKSITKNEIKFFFYIFFNIKLDFINICNLPIKFRKTGKYKGRILNYKKIYIKFKENHHLNNFLNIKNYLNY